MDDIKNRSFPAIKSTTFRPDRTYIKNAMEKYREMGGRIRKLDSSCSFYSDMQMDRNLLSEPGPFLDENHVRNRQLVE